MSERFIRLTRIEAPADDVYAWHMRPGALQRLTPPWVRLEAPHLPPRIENGARTTLTVRWFLFRFRWELEHTDCIPGQEFTDVQVEGPFRVWKHRHAFENDGAACFVEDRVEYEVPGGAMGRALTEARIRAELERAFLYRHRVLARDLAVHRSYGAKRGLRILLTGASGLIGSALRHFLTTGGHEVLCVTRTTPAPDSWISWDPEKQKIDIEKLNGLDAVIHLAGHPIFPGRWTASKKRAIAQSRIAVTHWLAHQLSRLKSPPSVFVTASATGYYGDRGAETMDEDSEAGTGFLAQICRAWEDAARPAAETGVRTVNLRFGVVLSPARGFLAQTLPIARLGLAGPLGSGHQFMSWIALDDAIEAIYHAVLTSSLHGPVNVVAPTATTQRDMFKTLAHIVGRPFGLPTPAFVLRMIFGKMADEVILASTRVVPQKLLDTGFLFQFPEIESALRHVLGYG